MNFLNRKNLLGIKYDFQSSQKNVSETIFESNNLYIVYLEGFEKDFYHYLRITYLVLKEIDYYKLFKNQEKRGSTLKNTILEIMQLLEQEKVDIVNKLDLCNIFLKPYAFLEARNSCNKNNQNLLSPTLFYLEKLNSSKRKINKQDKLKI